MPAKLIRLRYDGTCANCGVGLPAGTRAWWDAAARSTTCQACWASATVVIDHLASPPLGVPLTDADMAPPLALGTVGGSAQREYEIRHNRREQKIEQQWGRLAGVVKFLSEEPQNVTAWAKGSDGERRLAAYLQKAVGDRTVLLHDRKVPGTRGNIDHLAIAASGIWVIDAKNYTGLVEHRDVGGWFKTDDRIFVRGRDRTKTADGLGWQIDAVRDALSGADIPITGVVCFTDAEWRFLAKPFRHGSVWVAWAKKLVEMIAEAGPLTPADVTHIANRLATALPPACTAT